MATRTVGSFTEEKLRELAEQPDTVVYQPTHDIVYTPWSAQRVREAALKVASATRCGTTTDQLCEDDELREFSQKYTVFFQKLTDAAFVADEGHIQTVLQLIALRSMVEQGTISEASAMTQSADIALQSLKARVSS